LAANINYCYPTAFVGRTLVN